MTKRHNRKLLEVSLKLHQRGVISPNTYVVDLDTVKENAIALKNEARKWEIELFFMTKQVGRNPILAKAIVEAGIEKAVAVDPWEALSLNKTGIKIGHVGHLVQIPKKMIADILKLNPDYVTVFSYENAKAISDVANQLGKKQRIFLRIANPGDFLYDGQKGGFSFANLKENIEKLEGLTGVTIAGLTSFPCLFVQGRHPTITPNVLSMQEAKSFLENRGYRDLELNMPSATSTATLELLKENGATQAEPGHALTGTTPLHAEKSLAEKPGMVYVSEVSHLDDHYTYVYGGGFYPRSHMKHALVGSTPSHLKEVDVMENNPTSIDYYGTLCTRNANVGDTAIFAFRTQIFVTLAQIAVVKNLSSSPKLVGVYDSMGHQLNSDSR